MNILRILGAASCALLLQHEARAYEGDVHFGLTKWLALQAGFSAAQAEAIAIGNQRVDGGLIRTESHLLEFACVASIEEIARESAGRNYPSAKAVPRKPADRPVLPEGHAALLELNRLLERIPGKESVLLAQLGEAFHPLQDSWSHQGVPAVVDPGNSVACDPQLAMGHPLARGGPQSHGADHTYLWPKDAVEMARATYSALVAYPKVAGAQRRSLDWDSVARKLEGFTSASTKASKRRWFELNGIVDTSFLSETTLPNGAGYKASSSLASKLPEFPSTHQQFGVPDDVQAFYATVFGRWFGSESLEKVGADIAAPEVDAAQLTARLKLWTIADHGKVASLAHKAGALSRQDLERINQYAKKPDSTARNRRLGDVLLAVQPYESYAAPILPFIVRSLPSTASGHERSIAIARLAHCPYDSIGLLAEKVNGRWKVAGLVALVER